MILRIFQSALGATITAWGLWIILWASFDSTPTFRYMATVAEYARSLYLFPPGLGAEWFWGGFTIAAGILQIGTAWHGDRWARSFSCMISCALFVFISLTLISSNFRSTASVIYPALALFNGLLIAFLKNA